MVKREYYCYDFQIIVKGDIQIVLSLKNEIGLNSTYILEKDKIINIIIGEKVCIICKDVIISGYEGQICMKCLEFWERMNSDYLLRKQCMFREENSLLSKYRDCSAFSPLCMNMNNSKYCHSAFILYIGRINDIFKAGISSKSRGIDVRIKEQGLNEAIVIYDFKNMSSAMKYEKLIISKLSISEKIVFEEKLISFNSSVETRKSTRTLILDRINKFILPMFPEKNVKHISAFENLYLKIKECDYMQGRIKFIQGNIIVFEVLENNKDIYYSYNMKKIVARRIIIDDSNYNQI